MWQVPLEVEIITHFSLLSIKMSHISAYVIPLCRVYYKENFYPNSLFRTLLAGFILYIWKDWPDTGEAISKWDDMENFILETGVPKA
mmetsp:Transcript_33794/g.6114  ORF Transcript_33794/g.6114 Transcript_33794/m.6114 type:complete len:87 (-) Transcript_33794:751-1011(-)